MFCLTIWMMTKPRIGLLVADKLYYEEWHYPCMKGDMTASILIVGDQAMAYITLWPALTGLHVQGGQ